MKTLRAIGGVDSDLVARAAPGPQKAKKGFARRQKWAVSLAACLLFAVVLIGILSHNSGSGFAPPGGGLSQQCPEPPPSSDHGGPGPSGAVYHDLEMSQITRQPIEVKVPAEFWLRIRLSGALLNKTGSLPPWDKQTELTKTDIESRFNMIVQDPALPAGDYTAAGSVLRDVQTGEIAAYAIDYVYFDPQTAALINSFTLFYFDMGRFDAEKVTGTQTVASKDGEMQINEFGPPGKTNGKVPHVRSLVYFGGGIGIAIEAQAQAISFVNGSAVDQVKSLELFKKTDEELVEMMRSLIR